VTAFLQPHAQLTEVWTRAEPIDSGPLQSKERNHLAAIDSGPLQSKERNPLAARAPLAGAPGTGETGIARHLAIARVTYSGIPSGVGLSKDTMVLLTSPAYELDDALSRV
jgi:hypothetical protein